MENNQFRWIAENIDISTIYQKLPQRIKKMMAEAEEADNQNEMMKYYTICDDIEVHTKLLIPDIISDREWDMICEKYSLPE